MKKLETACEYKALEACLRENNWNKEKCEKEWLEFENLCSKNKRYMTVVWAWFDIIICIFITDLLKREN